MGIYAEIILNNANPEVDRIFDYEIPFEFLSKAKSGMRVIVPFGPKNTAVEGYCLKIKNTTEVPPEKIKMVRDFPDEIPVFDEGMIELATWLKEEYFTTLSQCLKVMVPPGVNLKNKIKTASVAVDNETAEKEAEKLCQGKGTDIIRGKVLRYIIDNGPVPVSEVIKKLSVSQSPLNTLEKRGLIKISYGDIRHDFKTVDIENKSSVPQLNNEQNQAFQSIAFGESKNPYLLYGITGSGKTEVYLSVIEEFIKRGKQAVVLVPEISLTPLIVGRFKRRFGNKAMAFHSKMSMGERYEVWKMALEGKISVVIGPRSAVFIPFKNIGIIIVDEEHELSYRSDSSPRYNAVKVAEKRCSICGAKLLLGSATPSVESFLKAKKGIYNILRLTKRAGGGTLPKTEIVDMRAELSAGNRSIFSRSLYNKMETALKNRSQIMLFLNRRGYSTFVSCRKCGYVMTCSNCSVPYKYHINGNYLTCHYCGKKIHAPTVCPECGSKYIKYFGTGTQKIEYELKRLFPTANVLRMDFDTTSKKGGYEKILKAFSDGEADILVGTQMIAKGHDFENVSLVGIMAADVSLNTGGYMGGEITFDLITQAAGRAGRGNTAGDVVIQTYQPDNYAVAAAAKQNYEEFFYSECRERKIMGYPPFSSVIKFIFAGKDENKVSVKVSQFYDIIKNSIKDSDVIVMGPSEEDIYKLKNDYRKRIILKCGNKDKLMNLVRDCMDLYRREYKDKNVMINIYII